MAWYFVKDLERILAQRKNEQPIIETSIQNHPYSDLDLLEIPRIGRALPVGGFVFTDPFDVFLRKLSEEYLAEAWSNLTPYLEKYKLNPKDLSWGYAHPGETGLEGEDSRNRIGGPHDFIGWTSEELREFYQEQQFALLDEDLKKLSPQLRCIATWRSVKWKIAPTNFTQALRLIEFLCTCELSEWSPNIVLLNYKETGYPWLKVVKAYNESDQSQFDLNCAEAKAQYTPAGYRIVMLAMTGLISNGLEQSRLRLPEFH